jgi:2-methylcitrate dehydratase
MVAIGLIFGELTADHYSDEIATDPRIDAIRQKMVVGENESFTSDYYNLEKRAIGNAIQVFFTDGSCTERVEVQYPIGHRVRRGEGIPIMVEKFERATRQLYDGDAANQVIGLFSDGSSLDEMPVTHFMDILAREANPIDSMLA